jgi:hypothetical protein
VPSNVKAPDRQCANRKRSDRHRPDRLRTGRSSGSARNMEAAVLSGSERRLFARLEY